MLSSEWSGLAGRGKTAGVTRLKIDDRRLIADD
jgi:hypothetical protein